MFCATASDVVWHVLLMFYGVCSLISVVFNLCVSDVFW
jgi:hypothetical protein